MLVGLAPRIVAMSSKTRPKRIDMLGSDGAVYRFLLKGGEDLHQEQRVQQLLSCVNACIRSYTHAAPASLHVRPAPHEPASPGRGDCAGSVLRLGRSALASAREARIETFTVTPLGHSMGLVQWVPQSVTLYDHVKGWQMRMRERYAAAERAVAPRQEATGPAKAIAEAAAKAEALQVAAASRMAQSSAGRGAGKPAEKLAKMVRSKSKDTTQAPGPAPTAATPAAPDLSDFPQLAAKKAGVQVCKRGGSELGSAGGKCSAHMCAHTLSCVLRRLRRRSRLRLTRQVLRPTRQVLRPTTRCLR